MSPDLNLNVTLQFFPHYITLNQIRLQDLKHIYPYEIDHKSIQKAEAIRQPQYTDV